MAVVFIFGFNMPIYILASFTLFPPYEWPCIELKFVLLYCKEVRFNKWRHGGVVISSSWVAGQVLCVQS